ncbi:uncharacterized protein LOC117549281 [Gymnodraco acuticeps]|uniref:Uncharacterized protein LOC117549281 n=1 Tax=Gymnodraco acuticeps TaxID=8218 RepID=A0A6P8UKU8_GYMAC|nr:uncharacterized protein LOC117549281 [Gymnodraco acuticeps]XP_034076941.1 uncharacterized protein LOC117549281 [Gymnodraco acuticeps]
MAEEILGKTVKELKKARTSAKSNFTRQANYLNREAGRMVEAELREEFTKLKEGLKKVLEANEDCMAGLQADAQKAEGKEEEVLAKREEADVERTAEEAEARMEEVRGLIQDNLWSRYGRYELITAIEEAEEASEQAGNVPVEGTNLEGYGVLLTILERRRKEATRVMAAWECWIPMMAKSDLAGRVKDLKAIRNRLEMRQGEFVNSRRIAAEELEAEAPGRRGGLPSPAIPVVRIKPTSLPIFYGCRREYYRWRKACKDRGSHLDLLKLRKCIF